jgi:hypothetical protein
LNICINECAFVNSLPEPPMKLGSGNQDIELNRRQCCIWVSGRGWSVSKQVQEKEQPPHKRPRIDNAPSTASLSEALIPSSENMNSNTASSAGARPLRVSTNLVDESMDLVERLWAQAEEVAPSVMPPDDELKIGESVFAQYLPATIEAFSNDNFVEVRFENGDVVKLRYHEIMTTKQLKDGLHSFSLWKNSGRRAKPNDSKVPSFSSFVVLKPTQQSKLTSNMVSFSQQKIFAG